MIELAGWLGKQGVADDKLIGFNKGGTIDVDGVKLTLTNAFHSSSTPDGTYGGEPAGFVIELENGTKLYFAGDTCVFGDMAADRAASTSPDVAIIPIGDHYTMGPREAAVALELLGVKRCVPCHWGTFPAAHGNAAGAAGACAERDGRADRAGRLGDGVRERWFGATGRRVPELALAGQVELGDALVLDGIDDVERLRAAFDAGTPVVVRAASAEQITAALARPEVACVLVPDDRPELLELDLTDLTYG